MTLVAERPPLRPETPIEDDVPTGAVQAPPSPPPVPPQARHPLRRRLMSEGGVVVVMTSATYLTVACLLSFTYASFNQDAVARMANGFYVLYSRDPHLASVGFVWEPLQSLADMVFLLPNHLWPALSHRDMAGALVSVIGMVGAVHQVRAALREWGVQRAARLVLTGLFALDPMILYYGGNGMSEGLYLFTLVATARYLLRWIHTESIRSLAYSGVALGFCYLTRNEAAAAAAAGVLVVLFVAYLRHPEPKSGRLTRAFSDASIFFLPFFVAAAGWAISSRIIVGEFFAQFTSIYGNSSQETLLAHKKFGARLAYEIHAVNSLGPLLAFIVVAAIVVALRKRDFGILAPIAVIGGALGFDVLAYLHNSIEDFYRYYITVVPLEVLLVGSLFAVLPASSAVAARALDATRGPKRRPLLALLGVLSALALLVPALVTTGAAMFNPKIGPQESALLDPIFHHHLNSTEQAFAGSYQAVLEDGDAISRLHLRNGSVVLDNFTACAPNIITTISQPKVFVIPNDRDFQRILYDPLAFGTRYILEADPAYDPITATNIRYPTLWNTGAGFSQLVMKIPARDTCPPFRLFHVLRHTSSPAG